MQKKKPFIHVMESLNRKISRNTRQKPTPKKLTNTVIKPTLYTLTRQNKEISIVHIQHLNKHYTAMGGKK